MTALTYADQRELIVHGFGNAFGRAPTAFEAQIPHGVGFLESNCGQGWKSKEGKESNNWGCIQLGTPQALGLGSDSTTWPGITSDGRGFLAKDTHPNADGTSTTYGVYFRRYKTPAEGAEALVRTVLLSRKRINKVLPRATAGDPEGCSRGLHETGYYEGWGATVAERIAHHFRSLRYGIIRIGDTLREDIPDTIEPKILHTMPTIRRGSTGDAVRAWQWRHDEILATGIFDEATADFTGWWQGRHGMGRKDKSGALILKNGKPFGDCIVGPLTWAASYV